MKQVFAMALLLGACSQGDAHPGNLGDCPPTCEGGTTDAKAPVDAAAKDATNDVSQVEAGNDATADAPVDATLDASLDAPIDVDAALLDSGAGD